MGIPKERLGLLFLSVSSVQGTAGCLLGGPNPRPVGREDVPKEHGTGPKYVVQALRPVMGGDGDPEEEGCSTLRLRGWAGEVN